jgi:two-component system sensor histidine kinase UhpB
LFSVLFWLLESVLHLLVFKDSGLLEQIFWPHHHEVWMRILVVSLFLVFGLYAQRMVRARQRAERETERARAEMAQIFDTAADGMRVVDRELNITCANETFADLVGLPKDEIVGKKCHEVFRGRLCDTPDCPLERVLRGELSVTYDAWKERVDGTSVPCMVTAKPFRWPNGEIMGIVEDFRDISDRVQYENELMESRERLRQLTGHLQGVREEERRRVAREIHDELGQALTALHLDLHWLKRRLPTEATELADKADAMSRLIGATVQSVRRLCSELRPGVLDDFGLAAAVEWQVGEFAKRTGIACDVNLDPPDIVVSEALSVAMFRILQEALTNVARHAQASELVVSLSQGPEGLALSVCDNGIGIDATRAAARNNYGLLGIRERARAFGGSLRVDRLDEGGTCLEVRIPGPVNGETDDPDTDRR